MCRTGSPPRHEDAEVPPTGPLEGKKAPVIVTRAMVEAMKPGSVVVDMAAEGGGNVEGTVAGKDMAVGPARVVGPAPIPPDVRREAMLAARAAAAAGRGADSPGRAATEALAGQGSHRVLLFFPYRAAAGITRQLRARRAALSAKRTGEPVHIRLDALDVL